MAKLRAREKILNVLNAARCSPIALSDEEVRGWQQRWRERYAKELHAATGEWVYNEFDWHVFTWGKRTAKQGDDAWSEFRGLRPGAFLVLSAYTQATFGFSCSGQPPDRLNAGVDILVTPPSLEWTMSFNHEHYGPYFAVP